MTLTERIQQKITQLHTQAANSREGAEYYHADHEYTDEYNCLRDAKTYDSIAYQLEKILEADRAAQATAIDGLERIN